MVKKGRFTVELVSADSKVKFQQHTKDGKTYVEVEPEAEYFVRVAAEPAPRVSGRIDVDGKSLGYKLLFQPESRIRKRDSEGCILPR
jgi:hypothetical protein